ncbi:MAG: transcription termination factor Rho [bacterium]|nr:transcription termination factor Rho [bacterium]
MTEHERKRAPSSRRRRGKRRGRGGQQGRGPGGRPHNDGRSSRSYKAVPEGEATVEVDGVLQVVEQGHGFLRSSQNDYNQDPSDPIVAAEVVQAAGLETGLKLTGLGVPDRNPGRPAWLREIGKINDADPAEWSERTPFKDLVAEDPTERIRMEVESDELSTRVVDLIAPIGKGQRCLVVAPPKAGKTVLLQKVAHSISENHPEIHLIVLLVDERPEEVTDMRRNVRGEVIASSSDEMSRNHVQCAEIVLERAKRLVEVGRDVVVLLDSITRLSRAYNNEQRGSGRVLSGGIDARTMEKPRRFFGAARKASDGGSLTVIGTALVDTGSRMDEVIFQEFKGTGNTEIIMDRGLFEQRIFPAIDIAKSGTRKEEKLMEPDEYKKVTLLRRALAPLRAAEAMRLLTGRLTQSTSNREFLETMQS